MNTNTQSCSDVNGTQQFKCICNEGFEGGRCEIDICDRVLCSENRFCYAGKCSCNAGYIETGNICVETCALDPCQELIQL